MYLVNFDFSEFHYHFKFLLINVPVVITQLLTYPLQRIQTQLISKDQYITKNQFQQYELILRQLVGIQGFPKLWNGVRYSLDYSVTQMTSKLFIFDYLMETFQRYQYKPKLYFSCIVANLFSTILSQSASNFQVLASSLAVNPRNRNQDVKIKLKNYMKSNKAFLDGLKYTVPINIVHTITQLLLLSCVYPSLNNNIKQQPSTLQQLGIIISLLLVNSFTSHYIYQKQVQICLHLKKKPNFSKGLLGTILRSSIRGATLYGFYYWYFQNKAKSEAIQGNFKATSVGINQLPKYRG